MQLAAKLLCACFCLTVVSFPSLSKAAESEETDGVSADENIAAIESDAAIVQWINDLDHPSIQRRQIAENTLINLGLPALPLVRAEFDQDDLKGESAIRLSRIVQSLQRLAIDADVKPSLITLSGSMSLASAVKSIQKQSENIVKCSDSKLGEIKVIVDYRDTLFWDAIDRLCDQAKCDVAPYAAAGELTLVANQNPLRRRTVTGQYTGPFRIEPTSVTAVRSFENPNFDNLRIGVQIAWEPRLRPLLFQPHATSIVGTCDDGSVVQLMGEASEISTTQSAQVQFELHTKLPPREATKFELSGQINTTIPGKPIPVRFKNLDQKLPLIRRIGDIIATIQAIRTGDGPVTQIDLMLKLGPSELRLDSFRNWLQINEAYAVDETGKQIPNMGWQTYLMNDREVGMTINFQIEKSLKDFQFVFAAPAALVESTIEFDLRDIPLP